ncbi:MAG TPA: LarC family nickel insertion protein, partial [Chthonomonadaceae bacterium]|nr:LarC family nickel insertion protein [Chthonomonadaceae bacterium]
TRLACAEAKIHATTPESIHFHEVGAVDAIVDIVGACIGLEMLGVEKVYASPLPLNRGWVECAHGTMPVPAPATLELLVGFPFRPDERPKELITPTGAALLAEFAERTPEGDIAPVPPMTLRAIGYGAGRRDSWIPNLLRVLLGDTDSASGKTPSGTARVKPLKGRKGQ